jgi:RimJ/RimL family protein N-acetyltransferase
MLYDNFETKNYKYYYFDGDNKDHCDFIEQFSNDKELAKFIPSLLLEMIDHSKSYAKGIDQYDVSFLVEKEDLILGAVIIHEYSDCCYIRYAISPLYRGCGFGTSILKDITENILNNHSNIESIRAVISNRNFISQKAALNAGYSFLLMHNKILNQSEYIYKKQKTFI